jgi:hypothetical protein
VQHAGDRACKLEQPALDCGVNVLIARCNRECARREFGRDGAQPGVERAMLRSIRACARDPATSSAPRRRSTVRLDV